MTKDTLKYIGAALYACEGTKARRDFRTPKGMIRSIEFTNTDPKIIYVFARFLREIINAEWAKVKGQIFYYSDLNEGYLIDFWSNVTGIQPGNFQKGILLKGKSVNDKVSHYGILKVRYSNKKDFLILENLIMELWRDAGAV